MLSKILVNKTVRLRPGLPKLRGGQPGWDRPDVPLNESYVHRRRITLDYNIYGHYVS